MKLHIASHIVSAIMYCKFNALITSDQILPEYAYDDYDLEVLNPEIVREII